MRTIGLMCVAGVICGGSLFAQNRATDAQGDEAPKANYDAFLASPIPIQSNTELQAAVERAAKPGTTVHMDEHLGVPTFFWAREAGPPLASGASTTGNVAETIARGHLGRHSSLYRLDSADLRGAKAVQVHNNGRGAVIVKFRKAVEGIEVFREELNVIMTPKLELLGLSGYLSPGGSAGSFSLQPEEAIARALTDLLNSPFKPGDVVRSGAAAGYGQFSLTPEVQSSHQTRLSRESRAKQVLYRLPDRLEPGYYVEVAPEHLDGTGSLAYSYVISATDGSVLFRKNQVSDAQQRIPYSYRVWADDDSSKAPYDGPQGNSANPHPAGVPDGYQPEMAPTELVTLSSGPISTGDPWLPAGATKTIGNNVEAYADLETPDGFTPASSDTHAFTNGTRMFDHVYDPQLGPQANEDQTQAAITQLFYTINFLHDRFYDAGFDEAAGNAQANNYGRGGIGNDSILAEAQDNDSRNNADIYTPADGDRPRMQMYLFDGSGNFSLSISSPSAIAGKYKAGRAGFGPQSFNIIGSLVLVNDGVGALSDGCNTPFANAGAVAGRIAVIDRGVCGFAAKVRNAQRAGAIAVLVLNNGGKTVEMNGADPKITIGVLSVSLSDGKLIKQHLAEGIVNATLLREAAIDRDGSLDTQIVAHEWGHYISNRLIADSVGLGTNIAQGLGEGWADFHSLLLTVRSNDVKAPAGKGLRGAFAVGGYALGGGSNGAEANNSFYFGARRVPYSTDFAKNSLTFKHISDAVDMPGGIPINLNGWQNSEVHNSGEVWATMLWECYAALLADTLEPVQRLTFDQAQSRMIDYLVASYKMTPPNPTLLEARDALLAAAAANDFRDYALFWEAFARRGAGSGARAPARYSYDNTPVVESFVPGGGVSFVSASLLDDVVSCDNDGFLDGSETGRLYVTLRNETPRPLTKVGAVITSVDSTVAFPNGNQISFQPIRPFQTGTAFVRVTLRKGVTAPAKVDFEISFNDPALKPAGPFKAEFETYANANIARNSSATDNVESPLSAWTPVRTVGTGSWQRAVASLAPFNNTWIGPDADLASDISLVSPPLEVGSKPLSFTFRHRFSFETDNGQYYDGGVVEISTDGGSTWTDIGTDYTGTVVKETGNPLAGRKAYTGTSNAYPDFQTTTIHTGQKYLNKRVQVRFRIGADAAVGGSGWAIDDLAFTGLTNTPFHVLVADTGCK